MAALLEQVNVLDFGWQPALMLAIVFVAIAGGWLSWRTYITVLERAELYGQCSTCPTCRAYGRFRILATGMDEAPGPTAEAVAPLPAAWLRVECRKCGTAWRMPD